MHETTCAVPFRMFVLDDDPFEHMVFQRFTPKMTLPVELFFAQTEAEMRTLLPTARPHLFICDSHVPPFYDYSEIVPRVRAAGYDGAIVVTSSLVESARLKCVDHVDVAAVCDKDHLSASMLDMLLARHGRVPS